MIGFFLYTKYPTGHKKYLWCVSSPFLCLCFAERCLRKRLPPNHFAIDRKLPAKVKKRAILSALFVEIFFWSFKDFLALYFFSKNRFEGNKSDLLVRRFSCKVKCRWQKTNSLTRKFSLDTNLKFRFFWKYSKPKNCSLKWPEKISSRCTYKSLPIFDFWHFLFRIVLRPIKTL